MGSDSLIELLTGHGYVIDADHAKVVVVGLDVKLTYEKLTIAGQRILDGARRDDWLAVALADDSIFFIHNGFWARELSS